MVTPRRSERLALKTHAKKLSITRIFQYNITKLDLAIGKKKLFYYEIICRLFLEYNENFKYNIYNIRDEVTYDIRLRSFLSSAIRNKAEINQKYIEDNRLSKKEENRILFYINKNITFIEKYLKKKQNYLYKTILNEDVIGHIISFL
jgi:hypothetical protein